MTIEPLFTQLPHEQPLVEIEFDGQRLSVPAGISLAAALLLCGARSSRTTPVSASPRAPYCLMGVCFECLVEVDGVPNCQACLISVRADMRVFSQHGARAVRSMAQTGVSQHEA